MKRVNPFSSEFRAEKSFVGKVEVKNWRQRRLPDVRSRFRFSSGFEKFRVSVSMPLPMVGDFRVIVVVVA